MTDTLHTACRPCNRSLGKAWKSVQSHPVLWSWSAERLHTDVCQRRTQVQRLVE